MRFVFTCEYPLLLINSLTTLIKEFFQDMATKVSMIPDKDVSW